MGQNLKVAVILLTILIPSLTYAWCHTYDCPHNGCLETLYGPCECWDECEDVCQASSDNPGYEFPETKTLSSCSGYHTGWYAGGYFIYYDCCWFGEFHLMPETIYRDAYGSSAVYCKPKPEPVPGCQCECVGCDSCYPDCSCHPHEWYQV